MEKETATTDDDLSKLFPEPVQCPIGNDVSIPILPMNLGNCVKFANKIRPLIQDAMRDNELDPTLTPESIVQKMLFSAIEHEDRLFEALALGSGKDVEYIRRLPAPAVMPLALTIFQVNIGFFGQYVGMLGPDVIAMLKNPAAASGAGLTH